MFIGKVAERWVNEDLEAYNEETNTFTPNSFKGRISLTDRFLSNFNRPLRRRMLHYSPGTYLPDSSTFRNPSTQDVYLIGQRRVDSDSGSGYHSMCVCHLVTDEGPNSSSGLGRVYRGIPQGPSEDPGWLVETLTASHYMDIEFRASLNDAEIHQERIESFLVWLPIHADLRKYDYVELHNHRYRVTDVYADSGFLMARIDREEDYRVDLYVLTHEEKTYDEKLMQYVCSPREYKVTMLLDREHEFASWVEESEDYMDLSVREEHIGFRPESGMKVRHEGRERVIRRVRYYRGERQYKIRVV